MKCQAFPVIFICFTAIRSKQEPFAGWGRVIARLSADTAGRPLIKIPDPPACLSPSLFLSPNLMKPSPSHLFLLCYTALITVYTVTVSRSLLCLPVVERGMRNWRQVTDDNKLQSKNNILLKGSKYRPKQQKDLTPIYRLHILDLVNLFLLEDFVNLAGKKGQ